MNRIRFQRHVNVHALVVPTLLLKITPFWEYLSKGIRKWPSLVRPRIGDHKGTSETSGPAGEGRTHVTPKLWSAS